MQYDGVKVDLLIVICGLSLNGGWGGVGGIALKKQKQNKTNFSDKF